MSERPQGGKAAGPGDPADFTTLFEASSVPMLVSELASGTYLAANEAFLATAGYGRDEVIGRSSLEVARWADPSERGAMVKALRSKGRVTDAEGRFLTKDGHERIGLFSAQVINYEGTPSVFLTLRDVTEERERAEELRATQERYQHVAELTSDFAFSLLVADDLSVESEWTTASFTKIFGFPVEEVDVARWEELVHPDDRDKSRATLATAYAEGSGTTEIRMPHADGTIMWIRFTIHREVDPISGRVRVMGVGRDITTEREEHEAKEAAQRRYQLLVEHLPLVTYQWDSNTAARAKPLPYISPQIEALLGFPLTQWQTNPAMWEARVHPDDLDRVRDEWIAKRDARGHFRSEYRMRTADGLTIWISDEARPLDENSDGDPLWQGVLLDITDRKHAEQEARERGGWLQSVFQAAFEGIAIHENGVILEANDEMARMFGFDTGTDLQGLNAIETLAAPESRDLVLAQVLSGSEEPYRATGMRRDGTRFEAELGGVTIQYHGREARLAMIHDLSKQVAAAEALNESEERFRSLVERIPAVTYLETWRDPADGPYTNNPLTYMSPQANELLGIGPDMRLTYPDSWRDRLHSDDKARAIAEDNRTTETGDPFIIDYRFVRPDGETVWIHEDTRLVRDADGNPLHWLGVMFDITERKRSEDTLRLLADRLVGLNAIAQALLKATSAEEIAAHAVGDIRALIGCELVSVIQMDADLAHVRLLAIDTEAGAELPPPGFRIPTGAHIDVAALGANEIQGPSATEELASSSQVDQMKDGGIRTVVYLPLFAEDTLLGALALFSHEDDYFTEDHLDIARGVADQLAVALHQAQLHERVETYASELESRLDDLRRIDAQRRKLLARLVHAQEEERQRIATDIHDDSIQKMAAVSLRLESLRRKLEDEDALRNLSQIEATVQGAIGRLRHLMFELWPPALDRHGLAVAVRTELEQTKGASGLDYSLRDEMDIEPQPETRTIAYRIIQEAVANARKHSEATLVEVRLSSENGGVQVRIGDNGKGLETNESPPGHMGLSTMRERAEMAGGWLRVNGVDASDVTAEPQKPIKGTTIEFWLPGPTDSVFAR